MTDSLRQRLSRPPILIAPGIYDALTALIAERAGFESLYVSGAAIAYTRLGRPDIGLVSMNEVIETVGLIRDRVTAHLVVDADTGYGNALNVERAVRLMERAGANAIQLEDQGFPKRCGHLDDKTLITAQEMVGKIKAAVDSRQSADTARACRAWPRGCTDGQNRAADGKYGGGRKDPAHVRTGAARARICLRDFPGRDRARAGKSRGRILRLAQDGCHTCW